MKRFAQKYLLQKIVSVRQIPVDAQSSVVMNLFAALCLDDNSKFVAMMGIAAVAIDAASLDVGSTQRQGCKMKSCLHIRVVALIF
jgi:hypothetical protein